MAEPYNPYAVSDPFLSRPEIASRRLYWSTQNDFAAGRRPEFYSSSQNSGYEGMFGQSLSRTLSRPAKSPRGGMGGLPQINFDRNYNRRLMGPKFELNKAIGTIDTATNLVRGVKGAVQAGVIGKAIDNQNARLAGLQQQQQQRQQQQAALMNTFQNYANAYPGNSYESVYASATQPQSLTLQQQVRQQASASAPASAPTSAAAPPASRATQRSLAVSGKPAGQVMVPGPTSPATSAPGSRGVQRTTIKRMTTPSNASPLTRPGTPAVSGPRRRGGSNPPSATPDPLDNPNTTGVPPTDWTKTPPAGTPRTPTPSQGTPTMTSNDNRSVSDRLASIPDMPRDTSPWTVTITPAPEGLSDPLIGKRFDTPPTMYGPMVEATGQQQQTTDPAVRATGILPAQSKRKSKREARRAGKMFDSLNQQNP